MNQGYNKTEKYDHIFHNEATGEQVIVNDLYDDGTYQKLGVCIETQQIDPADIKEIIELMKVPGTGLGMLILKLGRAFGRAVGAGSDAK